MDVRLNPEQVALAASVRRVVADLGPGAVGGLDDGSRAAELESAVTAAGWRELRSADDDGNPWASGVEVALIAEELGRGLADVSFVGPTLAAELRRRAGAPPPDTAETVLVAADLSGFVDAERIALDAAGADHALLVTSSEPGQHQLATVDLTTTTTPIDLTRPVAMPAGAPVAVDGPPRPLGDPELEHVAALGQAVACADLVGVMAGTTALAVDYVAERHQYGRPVGSFQAVQHLLADAHTMTEGARSAALHAAWAVDALPLDEAATAVAVAKAYTARSARIVCETSIQVHGGIGNTWECLAHVYLRRALVSVDLFGGVDACLERVLDRHGIGAH